MNFLPYAFLFGLMSVIVIDSMAMVSGAAAVNSHLKNRSRSSSSSGSGSSHAADEQEKMPTGYQEFIHAIQKNNLADAIMLLSQDRNLLNFQDPVGGKTPLIYAVVSNKPEMVQFLLQQEGIVKRSADGEGRNALEWAHLMNHKKIVKLLKGEKVNLAPWWKRRKK